MEIDEYQNYQKAQGALNEALKCLGKAKTKNPAALEAKTKFLKERLKLVKKFANARRLVSPFIFVLKLKLLRVDQHTHVHVPTAHVPPMQYVCNRS